MVLSPLPVVNGYHRHGDLSANNVALLYGILAIVAVCTVVGILIVLLVMFQVQHNFKVSRIISIVEKGTTKTVDSGK